MPIRKFPLKSEKRYINNRERHPENENTNKFSNDDLARTLKKQWSYYEFCERLEGDITVLDVSNGKVIL